MTNNTFPFPTCTFRLLEDGRTPATLRLTVRKLSAAGQYLARESRQCPIPSAVFSQFSKGKL